MSEVIPKYAPDDEIPAAPGQACSHFRALGHDRGHFFFMSRRGGQVISLSHSKLSAKASLFMLAPLPWWEREFPGKNGFTGASVDQAVNWIISICYEAGVFRVERMRGRGAWWDDGRLVIHAGDRLFVDGIDMDLSGFSSRYVYEALPALSVDMRDPMPAHESRTVLDFCLSLNWEKPIYGHLMAGWIAIASVCGAMPWRPHVFVTGPSGCGKSWVASQLAKLLGEFVLIPKGDTSEAGLRQSLRHDALPVTYDESEGEDARTAANIRKILGLMRQSSTEMDGRILKGGQDGNAQSFSIRSMFFLSAIRVPMTQTADENRVTVFSLRKNGAAERDVFSDSIIPLAQTITSGAYGSRFRARVFALLPTLRTNVVTFTQAAGRYFGTQRTGDQVGPMLAGAYFLGSDALVSAQQADAIIRSHDWEDQEEIADETDEIKCLTAILESRVTVQADRARVDLSIGELVSIGNGAATAATAAIVGAVDARAALERHGLLVVGGWLVISNTHRETSRLLRETAWGVGWGRILKRIDGAEQTSGRLYFAGAQSRGVRVPLSCILELTPPK